MKQTLYSFKVGRALKAARLARTLGQEEARRVRQAIALEAVRAYNSLLLTIEYVRINQRTLEQKDEHLTSVRNRRAAGVATELDVLRSEVDVENQRAQLTRARRPRRPRARDLERRDAAADQRADRADRHAGRALRFRRRSNRRSRPPSPIARK